MIKQAVILCAGLGTRLRPYTDKIPKVMIPILGKPLLQWHIEHYKKHGVKEFFINLHYLPEVIKNHFGDGAKLGVKITYVFEPVILGTAGGIKNFEEWLDDAFYVNWGDTFSLVNYTKTSEFFFSHPDAIGIVRVGRIGYRLDVDLLELDEVGRIIKIHIKPHERPIENPYSLRGSMIFKKRILSYIPPKGTYYEIGKELLPDIITKGEKFYGYECEEYSKGIDTIEKWKEVEQYLKDNGYQA
jgi:NDP-sugar pyrophosphorylase family protein